MSPPRFLLCCDMDGTLSFEAKQLAQWGSLIDRGQGGEGESAAAEIADGYRGDQSCRQPTLAFQYDDAYGPGLEAEGGRTIEMVPLPPSSTGRIAFVSKGLQRAVQELRSLGVYFVILTGARSSTTLSRLTGLPAPDAIVCESGGRLFLPATTTHRQTDSAQSPPPMMTLLSESWTWRESIAPPSLVGSYTAAARGVPPEKRGGDLWSVYHQVQLLLKQDPVLSHESKLTLDTNGYETCFRILNGGPFAERIAEKVDIPSTLVMQINLKHLDIMPACSSKGNAVKNLAKLLNINDRNFLFATGDDDNDVSMFRVVGAAYAPGNATPAVRALKEEIQNPDELFISQRFGPAGTEEGLRKIIARVKSILAE